MPQQGEKSRRNLLLVSIQEGDERLSHGHFPAEQFHPYHLYIEAK